MRFADVVARQRIWRFSAEKTSMENRRGTRSQGRFDPEEFAVPPTPKKGELLSTPSRRSSEREMVRGMVSAPWLFNVSSGASCVAPDLEWWDAIGARRAHASDACASSMQKVERLCNAVPAAATGFQDNHNQSEGRLAGDRQSTADITTTP
jgi:hypothetical protein